MKSPINPTNYIGMRPAETDKVFENLVPVQMQLSPTEERKHFLRLSVELKSSGMSANSFRKARTNLIQLRERVNTVYKFPNNGCIVTAGFTNRNN